MESTLASIVLGLIAAGISMLFLMNYLEQRGYRKADIDDIDRMGGLTFEKYLVTLFTLLGYVATKTDDHYDFGADLILEKNSEVTVVQAKRYRHKVRIDAVQQVVAAKMHYKADKAMVVTNSGFTNSAYQLAKSNGVELMGRKRLIKAIAWVKERLGEEIAARD